MSLVGEQDKKPLRQPYSDPSHLGGKHRAALDKHMDKHVDNKHMDNKHMDNKHVDRQMDRKHGLDMHIEKHFEKKVVPRPVYCQQPPLTSNNTPLTKYSFPSKVRLVPPWCI